MTNPNMQSDSTESYKGPETDVKKPLIERMRDRIISVKDRVAETFRPTSRVELEEKTGEALTYVAEQTIQQADQTGERTHDQSSEIIEAVSAAAGQTVEGELAGHDGNPLAELKQDGYSSEVIEATVAIAETDRPLAEQIADEIDRLDGLEGSAEVAPDGSYEGKVGELKRTKLSTVESFVAVETQGMTKSERKSVYDNPENWEAQRQQLHETIVSGALEAAQALSERLKQHNPKPTIYALRGNTASGKTRALAAGNEMFAGILDEEGEPSGALNPDSYKYELREGHVDISAGQVHDEGSMLGRRVDRELTNPDTSMVLDKRNETPEDIADILANAAETDRAVRILDVDAPVETSLVGVLLRQRGGADPNVPFEAIVKGYVGIRASRRELFASVKEYSGTRVDGYMLTAFDYAEKKSVTVAQLDGDEIRVVEGREELAMSVSVETDPSVLQAEAEAIGDRVITDEYIEEYVATYIGDAENVQAYAQKVRAKLGEFKGKTLRRAVDTMADASSAEESVQYLTDANQNLLATSRTANGTVDVSASGTKAESMEAIDGDEAAEKAKRNFDTAIMSAFEQRDKEFSSPEDVRQLVEGIAAQINEGIVKEGALIRSGEDSDKYPYTRLEDLPAAMQQFYQELQQRMANPDSDPVETAAFCEYRIDMVDHFFADGCGKSAKAMSSFILMRAGLPLPKYEGGREEYYKHSPGTIAGQDPAADQAAWQNFLGYYKRIAGAKT
ncbi:MAG: zeta toxin family protein [Candidatus Microsaccharimonas sp.]